MTKVREIEDKTKAPRLEKTAVKSFVRNALFDVSSSNEKVLHLFLPLKMYLDSDHSYYDRWEPKSAKLNRMC